MSVTIEFNGLPLSVNEAYATFRGRRIKTRAAHKFTSEVQSIVRASKLALSRFKKSDRLSVELLLYSDSWFTKSGSIRKIDIDNFLKILLDAIFSNLVCDDSQIFKLDVIKCVETGSDRTIVKIDSMETN